MANNPKVTKAPAEALTPNPAAERVKLAALIIIAMLMAGGLAAVGTWWLMEQRLPQLAASEVAESALPAPPPIYETLEPPFVVNLKQGGKSHYLQVGIALMGRHAEELSALKAHLPLLRSHLLMLFSGQEIEKLTSAEGKEALRQQATLAVQEIAQQVTGSPVVEQVLFTGLVVQ